MNFKEIEKAGFRSWPALEESELDGIVLRFSNGYTKRANSANLLQEQDSDFDSLVSRYEGYFRDKDLPCIFRINSILSSLLIICSLQILPISFPFHFLIH